MNYYNNDTLIEQANEITRLTKQRDELAAALALIKPGNELGDFLIYATMPWAAMKDIVRMEEALAAVKESKEN